MKVYGNDMPRFLVTAGGDERLAPSDLDMRPQQRRLIHVGRRTKKTLKVIAVVVVLLFVGTFIFYPAFYSEYLPR